MGACGTRQHEGGSTSVISGCGCLWLHGDLNWGWTMDQGGRLGRHLEGLHRIFHHLQKKRSRKVRGMEEGGKWL